MCTQTAAYIDTLAALDPANDGVQSNDIGIAVKDIGTLTLCSIGNFGELDLTFVQNG